MKHTVRLRIVTADARQLRRIAHRNRLDLCFGSVRRLPDGGGFGLDAWLETAAAAALKAALEAGADSAADAGIPAPVCTLFPAEAAGAEAVAAGDRFGGGELPEGAGQAGRDRRAARGGAAPGVAATGYLNTAEVESAVAALAAAWPGRCERIVLPWRSHEGREISALRIGTLPPDQGDVLLLTGSAHAREWGGADTCVAFAADLLRAHGGRTGLTWGGRSFKAAEIRRIVDGMHIVLVPDVNPDGRAWSQQRERMWRRNRRPPGAGHAHPSCAGVDLNRNYDFLWDYRKHFHADAEVGTSDNPCDPQQTWRGPAPLSEPETQNIDWLMRRYPGLRWYVDIHSYGELILYPWGDDDSQSADPAMGFHNPAWDGRRGIAGDTLYREYLDAADGTIHRALAATMAEAIQKVRGKRYTAQPGYNLYPTSGTADDYAWSLHRRETGMPKIHAFTVEFGTEFQPPWQEMKQITGDLSAGLLAFALQAQVLSGRARLSVKTPLRSPAVGATAKLEVTVESMRDIDLILEAPEGYAAPPRRIRGAPGRRTARLSVKNLSGAGGSLTLRCPQTGDRWDIPLMLPEESR